MEYKNEPYVTKKHPTQHRSGDEEAGGEVFCEW